jgi:flagellar basal-body rod protein FlgC
MTLGAFGTIDVATSGVTFSRYWLDTIAHNLANVNTVNPAGQEPFRARYLRAEARLGEPGEAGEGVRLKEITAAQGDAPVVYDPQDPNADAQGYVTHALVDVAGNMSDLIVAQRSYTMNIRVVQAAKEAYESALKLGH